MSPLSASQAKRRQLLVDAERHGDLGEYFGMVRRSIRALGRRVPQNDVSDLILLAATIDIAKHALTDAVNDLRDAGMSWEQIGDALGVSKQAAEKRFGGAR